MTKNQRRRFFKPLSLLIMTFFITTCWADEVTQKTSKSIGRVSSKLVGDEAWRAFGGVWGNRSYTRNYNSEKYIYIAARNANAGLYKRVSTKVGETYRVSAELLGADINRDKNFIANSYITVSSEVPRRDKSHVIASSKMVKGSSKVVETFTFVATSRTSYIGLRSDRAWQYANVRAVSVKEVGNENSNDENSNDENSNDENSNDVPPPTIDHVGVFKHPGVFVTKGQLDFVRRKISNGESPWKEAFYKMRKSRLASKYFNPNPKRVIPYGYKKYRNTTIMEIESYDSQAAYTQSLMWYFTKNKIYAKNTIKILNAWSRTIQKHIGTSKGLTSAWSSIDFVRAAEIIRYTNAGWRTSDIRRFEKMLRDVYLVNTINGNTSPYTAGNWELLMSDATISMGVFLNDKDVFNKGLKLWRRRVPAYIYLTSDGRRPILPPDAKALAEREPNYDMERYLWYNEAERGTFKKRYYNGMSQETCRDFGHVSLGFGAMIHAAETAYIQGVNLYKEEKKRIIAGVEFETKYLKQHHYGNHNEFNIPHDLCLNNIDRSGKNYINIRSSTVGANATTYEVVYNHYVNRMGMSLPNTHDYVYSKRPTGSTLITLWETLTNADVGDIGR